MPGVRLFKKTLLYRVKEERLMSIVDDLAGEELRTRVTSAAVTGYNILSMALW